MTSVTLCIPAWQSEDTVGRAIESALAQTHAQTRVLVSVDQGEDGTAQVCQRYAGDPRIEVVVHDHRLGWAGNINYCLDRIETDALAMVFHDDWIEPHYCETLVGLFDQHPKAVAVTGALSYYGEMSRTTFFEDAAGPLYDRLLKFVTRPMAIYTLKAMHRALAFRDGLRLRDDGGLSFQADVTFSMEVLLQGEFRATDEVLYHKQRDTSSVSGRWRSLTPDDYFARQIEIRAQLVELVAAAELSDAEKAALTAAILSAVNRDIMPEADARDLAAWHTRVAAALAVRLAGGKVAAEPLPKSVIDYRAQQLRRHAWLARQDGHPALANAKIGIAKALEGADGGPQQAIETARNLLKPPRTPERVAAALEAAESVAARSPSNVPAQIVLARALDASGEAEKAQAVAERAEAIRGESIPALAVILKRSG